MTDAQLLNSVIKIFMESISPLVIVIIGPKECWPLQCDQIWRFLQSQRGQFLTKVAKILIDFWGFF